MIVVILAGTYDEAREHARLAGLARRDVVLPLDDGRVTRNLDLSHGDLIVELPSFIHHPAHLTIQDALLLHLVQTPAADRPVWHKVEAGLA